MKLATCLLATTATLAALAVAPAIAADPASCGKIRMSDPGWTDITSTNAISTTLLEALGYDTDIKTLSVPVSFEALKTGDIDVFLGNWMPAQTAARETMAANKSGEVLAKNLGDAKMTLAVPTYVEVDDFKDLAANADKFDSRIYGIEAGAAANQNIQKAIDADEYGLGKWTLVETGEQAMLAQVARAEKKQDWIVFLGWAPHPMNINIPMKYLSGGDDVFGPNYGGAEVYTLSRPGFAADCPNAAQLFKQLTFSLDMENQMMNEILGGEAADTAAAGWIKANPAALDGWLAGVTTLSGEPGLPAVKAELGF